MNKCIAAFFMSGLLTAVAEPASASCVQANLAGEWVTTSVSQSNAGALGWVACVLTIAANGTLKSSGSECVASNGAKASASGSLILRYPTTCVYSGYISFPALGTTDTIQIATLSMDHYVVSGLGGGLGSGAPFVFNMVKVK